MTTRGYDNLTLHGNMQMDNYRTLTNVNVATTCTGSIRGRYNPTLTNVTANNTIAWSAGVFSSMVLATSGIFAVDNVNVSDGDTILIKNEDDSYRNGVYTISISGPALSMTRSTRFNAVSLFIAGSMVNVLEGYANGGKSFILQTIPTTINTTDIIYRENYVKESNIVQLDSNSSLIIARRKDDQIITWGIGTSFNTITYGRGVNNVQYSAEVIPKKQPGVTAPIGKIRKLGNTYKNIIVLDENNNLYTEGINSSQFMGNSKTNATYYRWHLVSADVLDFKVNERLGYDTDDARLYIKKTDNYWYVSGYNGGTYGSCGVNSTSTTISTFTKIKHNDASDVGTDVRELYCLGNKYGNVVIQKTDDTIWVAGANRDGELGMANTTAYTGFVDNTAEWVTNRSLTTGYTQIMQCLGGSCYYDASEYNYGKIIMLIGNGTIGSIIVCGNQQYGSLGNGITTDSSITTPAKITIGSESDNITKFDMTILNSLFISDSFTCYVTGYNSGGQLGDGTTTDSGTPTNSNMPSGVKITDAWFLYCSYNANLCNIVLKTDFGIYISGDNTYGCAGNGTTTDITTFELISNEDVIGGMSVPHTTGTEKLNLLLTNDGRILIAGRNTCAKTDIGDSTFDYLVFTELKHHSFSC